MVVSNASPLIAMIDVGLGAILDALFGEVLVPPAVRHEVFANRSQPAWITERLLAHPDASGLLRGR